MKFSAPPVTKIFEIQLFFFDLILFWGSNLLITGRFSEFWTLFQNLNFTDFSLATEVNSTF